jgi:hypothetical protein
MLQGQFGGCSGFEADVSQIGGRHRTRTNDDMIRDLSPIQCPRPHLPFKAQIERPLQSLDLKECQKMNWHPWSFWKGI